MMKSKLKIWTLTPNLKPFTIHAHAETNSKLPLNR
ncbi:UNVERIFIED_CONTAM: hypothetical protein GTU68_036754 [Idotea baltica]|nr:hypothetical protein [Idotea baltica]